MAGIFFHCYKLDRQTGLSKCFPDSRSQGTRTYNGQSLSLSSAVLTDILSERVLTASVPGGYYSEKVARASAIAGLETLFTSEPTTHTDFVEGCLVKGRFMIQRNTSARTAAALARGAAVPQFRQLVWWNSKKALKAIGGRAWVNFRNRVLACKGELRARS